MLMASEPRHKHHSLHNVFERLSRICLVGVYIIRYIGAILSRNIEGCFDESSHMSFVYI